MEIKLATINDLNLIMELQKNNEMLISYSNLADDLNSNFKLYFLAFENNNLIRFSRLP